MRSRRPTALLTSHFGAVPDIDEAFELARRRGSARGPTWPNGSSATTSTRRRTPSATPSNACARTEFETDAHRPFEEQRYDVLGSIRMNAQGLARYWRKRWEREAASEAQPSAASRSAASNADGS